MESRSNKILLSIPDFKGLNTSAPRGTALAPILLENVYLSTGGYSPQSVRTQRIGGVTSALSAGSGDHLFVTTAQGTSFARNGLLPQGTIWQGDVKNAVLLMPFLALTTDGGTYLRASGAFPTTHPTPVIGTDLNWSYQAPSAGGGGYPASQEREWLLLFESGGTATFKTGASNGTPPDPYALFLAWQDQTKRTPVTVYSRINNYSWEFVGYLDGLNAAFGPGQNVTGSAYPHMTLRPATAAYHQGRVYMHAGLVEYPEAGDQLTTTRVNSGWRIYYSDTIAAATDTSLPRFSPAMYYDVPFRVSESITALVSVGPYLYVFGDRELWVMTGDPERDARLESLGDSIGTVYSASVQQLAGTVYWLSDSGLMAVQGTSMKEVGTPVRDLLLNLGPVSSTVDFGRELYLISDGTLILCYHAREDGWTTRALEEPAPLTLLYAGGKPGMLQGGSLYTIGSNSGPLLTMRIRWPHYELGDWRTRKQFAGLAFGLDLLSQAAQITHTSTVDGQTTLGADTAQTVTASGFNPVRLHTAQGGIGLSGCALSVGVEVSTQDGRGLMRPPLQLYGTVSGEETWNDYAQ